MGRLRESDDVIIATKAAVAHSGVAVLPYQWVVVGVGGRLSTSTSTTANSWTSQTSSFSSDNIYSVCANGQNLYVAVGHSGKLATSPDGITWTQQTSSFGADQIRDVAWTGSKWVAVGTSGKIATSSDGITWTQQTSGTANTLLRVAYGGGVIVTTDESGTGRRSSDGGTTWLATGSTSLGAGAGDALTYSSVSSTWLAGQDNGTTGALASAPTAGTPWTARNAPQTLNGTEPGGAEGNASVTVYTGHDARIFTTTDGTSFTNRTPAYTTNSQKYDVAVDDLGTFAVLSWNNSGYDWYIETSSNGTTWTGQGIAVNTTTFNAYPSRICHSSGKYAARP